MNHIFIINPAAGKGKALRIIPEIEKLFKESDEKFTIELTKGIGHATEIAKRYSGNKENRIYSVGGDGTLNEVLNGMINGQSSLGVIPSGSGNDFIKSIYNYSKHENIEEILERTVNGIEKKIDLGKINDRYFLNISSVGFDAEVAYNAIRLKKLPLVSGKLAYILSIIITVFKYSSLNLSIEIDNEEFNIDSLLLAVANGNYYGGGINITPDAKIHDGLFDICLVKKVNKLKLLALFPKAIKGTHGDINEVSFYRGEIVKINCKKNMALNIDGEIIMDKKAEFEIIRDGVNIVFPLDRIKRSIIG